MGLSNDLISQFVKATKSEKEDKKESIVYGTTVEYNGSIYVRLDGSDRLTPVSTTAGLKANERVTVMIKNHTATVTGNISSPSASTKDVNEVDKKVEEVNTKFGDFETVMAHTITADELTAINATINSLRATVATIDNIEAATAMITELEAKFANLEHVTAKDAEILNADIENLRVTFGEFDHISADTMDAINADIDNLKAHNAKFTYVSATKLSALQAEIDEADVKYAKIDFANIQMAAIQKLFSDSGIIKDLVVSDGRITGELVGVTLKGDLIEGNTIKADKLVVKGSDGLFYKLNIGALGESVSAEEVPTDSLHGSVITAKSIVAEKIAVDDLVAFGATIGGFHITKDSIYSGVKASATSPDLGIFLGKDGQFAVGDDGNFIKFFKDANGKYKLDISAESLHFGSSKKSVADELDEIRDEVTTNLRIDSSRGTVFKNNAVSTVLSAVIYRGSQRITDITALRAAMGSGAYLQWKWQRLDDDSFGVISASDSRLGNDGFTFTITPDDVDTKVTFMCELIV